MCCGKKAIPDYNPKGYDKRRSDILKSSSRLVLLSNKELLLIDSPGFQNNLLNICDFYSRYFMKSSLYVLH